MLVDLGPVSQDKAVTACGYEEGATVVTFDKQGEEVSIYVPLVCEATFPLFHKSIASSKLIMKKSLQFVKKSRCDL